uniref:Uncharacterized protein n=1 Tax=viral metagenome TaxID=1070528 RepID=A0A6M3J5Q6_9ZZZZ
MAPIAIAIPTALKALYASPHFLHYLLGGAFLGQTALSEYGKAGERGITKEELRIQERMGISQAKATKRLTEESREQAKEYVGELMKAKREERKESREQRLMELYMGSQDRQMALLMQALQGITQTRPKAPSAGAAGMLGLMRS